jgi:hypothetical protein
LCKFIEINLYKGKKYLVSTEYEDEVESKKTQEETSDEENDITVKFLEMYSTIYTMRQDLERVRKPVGTRENPVRTCRDLYYGHPQFPDGKEISNTT